MAHLNKSEIRKIERRKDGAYTVTTLSERGESSYKDYDSLNEAMESQEAAELTENEYTLGYWLGERLVEVMEGRYDADKILAGLSDSTDAAWGNGAQLLAEVLQRFGERI